MEGDIVLRRAPTDIEERLAAATCHLDAVLETVDLERDRELAEAALDAVTATDRAYRLERSRGGQSDADLGYRRRTARR